MADKRDKKQRRYDEEAARFVMSFVEESDKMREEFMEVFEETLANYMVHPYDGT